MLNDIGKWANENQGLLSIIIPILVAFFGWISGLFKWIFRKFYDKKQNSSFDVKGKFKAEGPIVIGNNNTIIFDSSKSDQEKQVEEMESEISQGLVSLGKHRDVRQGNTEQIIITPDEVEYRKALNIISGGRSPENKSKLRSLYYSTTDKATQLQIIVTLAEWFMPSIDNTEDSIALCDEGIMLADEMNAKQEKAILLAYKGKLISIHFADLDSNHAYSSLITNLVGINFSSEEERSKVIDKLNDLYESFEDCFRQAEQLAKEIKSYKVLGTVYLQIGEAAGHRYIHLNHFGVGMAEKEKMLTRRAFMLAKNIYASQNDEPGIAYVYYNFANQLRNFNENNEALELLQQARLIATKHQDNNLLNYINVLSDRICSGNIPNYSSS